MPAHQMRRATAHAVSVRRRFKGRDHRRMVRQPQIIVAAKINDAAAVQVEADALRRIDHAAGAVEALLDQLGEFRAEVGEGHDVIAMGKRTSR